MESLVAAKLAGLAILLVSALFLGLLPFLLSFLLKRRSSGGGGPRVQLAISCMQCLGGGVLLATVFTHMLPEIHESLAKQVDFPLAEVLLCVGMFIIYIIEECVTLGVTSRTERRPDVAPGPTPSGSGSGDEANSDTKAELTHQAGNDKRNYGAIQDNTTDVEGNRDSPTCPDVVGPPHSGHGHSHLPSSPTMGSFRVLIVAVALSVHSVFDGMAIGLETSTTSAWLLTAAIAAHKCIIAFCLGEQLAASTQRPRIAFITLLIFVAASPVGIIIGLLVTSTGDVTSSLTPDVLQALAAGTILYVVLFEIIAGERAKPGNGLVKLAAILVGFGLMLALSLAVAEPDEDSHGGEGVTGAPVTTPVPETGV